MKNRLLELSTKHELSAEELNEVKEMLKQDEADELPYCVDEQGRTVLYNACRFDNLDLAEMMLEHGANPQQKNIHINLTPLNVAKGTPSTRARSERIAKLIEETYLFEKEVTGQDGGLKIEEKIDLKEASDAQQASNQTKNEEDIKSNKGADKKRRQKEREREKKQNPLMAACRAGNVDEVSRLLENGETDKINTPDNESFTPLHIAYQKDNPQLIDLLKKHEDVDTSIKDKDGKIPAQYIGKKRLEHLTQQSREKFSSKLKTMKSDIELVESNEAVTMVSTMEIACTAGDLNALNELAEAGMGINSSDSFGNPMFLRACGSGNLKLVNRMIELGANPQESGAYYRNAFHWLASHSVDSESRDQKQERLEIAKILLKNGVDGRASDITGYTASQFAREQSAVFATELEKLIEANEVAVVKETPFRAQGAEAIKERLCELVRKFGGKDPKGEITADMKFSPKKSSFFKEAEIDSLLGAACQIGNVNIAEELIAYGADVNREDVYGYYPLSHACMVASPDLIDRLINTYDADPLCDSLDGQNLFHILITKSLTNNENNMMQAAKVLSVAGVDLQVICFS